MQINLNRLKAFTLFELLIVTFIISLVYVMFVVNFKTSEKEALSLKTFKEYISKQEYKQYVKLTCLENEKFCRLYLDDKQEYESLTLFKNNEEIIVYDFDKDNEPIEVKFGDFQGENEDVNIVLNMYFYGANKHKPYLIDDGNRIVYFSIFRNIIFFDNINEAKEFFIQNKENMLDIYKERLR